MQPTKSNNSVHVCCRQAPEVLQNKGSRWMSYVQFRNGAVIVPRDMEEQLRYAPSAGCMDLSVNAIEPCPTAGVSLLPVY